MASGEAPLVLMAVERLGWCFNNIANALQHHLSNYYRFKVMPTGRIAREECDVLVCFWWDHTLRVKGNVKCKGVITCLYDELSWHINENSRAQFKLVLKHSDVLAVCNEHIAQRVVEIYGSAVPEILITEDGVDTDLFKPMPLPKKFTAGWTGNSARHTPGGPDDLKGFNIVKNAITKLSGRELRVLDAARGGSWPLEKMPKFYEGVSAVVIGSACEGTPNPLLEGLACGRPVISTKVGLAPKVIRDGINGFLVERNDQAIANAADRLAAMDTMSLQAMCREARASAMQWSWKKKCQPWNDAIRLAMRIGSRPDHQMPGHHAPVQRIEHIQPAVRREPHDPPKVLCISDVPGWAFHVNMTDMAEALKGRFQCDHWFIADWETKQILPDMEDYDAVFCVYHRWGIDHLLPWDRTVGSLRALWFYPERPAVPTEREYALVNRYRAFHVVTRQNYDELRDHCPGVFYLTNPVNMQRYAEPTQVRDRVIASWNGNGKHLSASGQDVKAFWSMIVPVIKATSMPFEFVEYHTNRVAPEAMPEFYQKANLAICMSLYEGASNSVMEAMASGQALITTDCGNAREMHEAQLKDFGESGIMIIERSIQQLADALKRLRYDPARVCAMGALNREEIRRRWSWDVWKEGYAQFLTEALHR